MKKELRKKYPKDWKQLSTACKERANWHCEKCGIAHKTPRITYRGDLYPVYLVAAHISHDRDNPSPKLKAVCPSCHWRYFRQFGHRPAWIIARLRRQGRMK